MEFWILVRLFKIFADETPEVVETPYTVTIVIALITALFGGILGGVFARRNMGYSFERQYKLDIDIRKKELLEEIWKSLNKASQSTILIMPRFDSLPADPYARIEVYDNRLASSLKALNKFSEHYITSKIYFDVKVVEQLGKLDDMFWKVYDSAESIVAMMRDDPIGFKGDLRDGKTKLKELTLSLRKLEEAFSIKIKELITIN